MAIDIIPKQETKQKTAISPFKILYYLVVILLFATFLSYFFIEVSLKGAKQNLEELKIAISAKETKELKELEAGILRSKKQIDIFSSLFASYKKASSFFNFLKQNCHKQVFFSNLDLNIEGCALDIAGKAESFKVLGEQILVFQEQGLINNVSLTSLSMEREGRVKFELSLSLNSGIFK